MFKDKLVIKGAREHNLKNINVEIPKNKLVIITGVSGSGKSSLAFSTIYAEGQRRYLDSLSSYARQFLGNSHKPNVDSIEGLSPSIAIDQKSTSHNPRSTVGTVTEIYDYFRLLFARIGTPYCINGHGIVKTQTLKQIVDVVLSFDQGDKIQILAPLNFQNQDLINNVIDDLRKDGFLRVIINNTVFNLDDEIKIDKDVKTIDVIVDRIILNKDTQTKSRLNSSIELALNKSNGLVKILRNNDEYAFNESYSCNQCSYSIKNLEPSLFSFNSPLGACEYCNGLGFTYEPDEIKMIPDPELSISEGAIDFFKNTGFTNNLDWQRFYHIIKHYNIDIKKPFKLLDKKEVSYLLYGSQIPIQITLISANNRKYEHFEVVEGVCELISRRHQETSSESAREYYSKYMSEKQCKYCKGMKLNKLALSVLIDGKNIFDVTNMDINQAIDFFLNLNLTEEQKKISDLLLKEIISRLSFLSDVGLEYLTLSRTANTLSGGEAQRIRLASQIGSNLTGVLYVLDEPSIGLHQRDNEKLISTLYKMRDLGNTLIVVEHDEDTMRASDYIIDIGPGAGIHGGNVVASGTIDEIIKNSNSLTGQYLSKTKEITIPKQRRKGNGNKIVLKGAKGNNLKNINVEFPLNKLICVTGVSGSGKSTLIMETLVKGIQKQNFNPFIKPLEYKELTGTHNIDKLVEVTQDPIGRTPRSNPATYIGVFDEIRDLFANLKESKEKGYTKARFSFNVKGGRCEKCQGDGEIKIDMHFLPTVYVVCDDCKGYKYNDETLSIRYKTKNIYDVLKMSAEEALEFFKSFPSIHRKLQLLVDVGLGYIELGASSKNLSGGEAQRIKLTKFLQRKPTGKTLYVLDEPTTGLHIDDIDKLIKIFNRIVDGGDTVLIIEHNLDIIKVSDYIIDIGPEGGKNGGYLVCSGTPEFISNNKQSHTARFLKKIIDERK